MKNLKFWGFLAVIILVAAVFYALGQFGKTSPLIAKGTLTLPDELTEKALGIRQVFITVFDADSGAPMPLGAMREHISQDASGKFMDFLITPERLMMMNPEAQMPKQLRIKARLDLDGMGGPDQPGDITGELKPVEFGSTSVNIVLDKVINAQ